MATILTSLRNTVIAGFVLAAVLLLLYLNWNGWDGAALGHAFWAFVFRWLHVISGVMWIGLLWYFNFVQIPSMPSIPDEQKPAVSKVIAPTALFWFRWGAMATIVTGIILAILVLAVVLVAGIVFFERAQRRLLIQYPKRQVGNRMFQGDTSHLPLKLNTAGVIPPIFASSLLLLPATLAGFSDTTTLPAWASSVLATLGHGQPLYMLLYGGMIAFFAFFYTAIVFNPKDTADQLKKHSGFIPGYRPGERTAEYIDYVLTRITAVGALYLVIVCLIPEFLISATGVPFYLGGTSLLIVVSVTLDTVAQVQGHLIAHQYEGLIKKSKLRGGKRGK